MTFNISIPKELIERIDKAAEAKYTSRSNWIRQACMEYLKKEEVKK